jgi:hypothetical protein
MSTQRHRLLERRDDCYETPAVAVQALLQVEVIPHRIWEPCCGPGAIVRALRVTGRTVVASDLVDYGCPDSESRIDFLMERRAPPDVDVILTNFPYKLAGPMVEHALQLCPLVIVLLRLAFLESDRRSGILDRGHLARVHVFKDRLPMMHRRGWDGPKASSTVPYAWFVWDRNHDGPTTIHRISWRGEP